MKKEVRLPDDLRRESCLLSQDLKLRKRYALSHILIYSFTELRCRNGNDVITGTPAKHSSSGQNRGSRFTKDEREASA